MWLLILAGVLMIILGLYLWYEHDFSFFQGEEYTKKERTTLEGFFIPCGILTCIYAAFEIYFKKEP